MDAGSAAKPTQMQPVVAQTISPPVATGQTPPLLLVVDDSAAVREQLRLLLTGPAMGARVILASEGAAALRVALDQPVDCVLCDLTMPGMDGLTFLRTVRVHRSQLELPVILLTASNAPKDRVVGLRLGASDYVAKPPDPVELLLRTQRHVQLARVSRELTLQAQRDQLTGLVNRRVFLERLSQELNRGVRAQNTAALVLADVDHFKQVNDQHGHPVGDAVLKDLGAVLNSAVRPYDTAGRLGGEEFGILLPNVDAQGARAAAQRVRSLVFQAALGGLAVGSVTVSLGLAVSSANTSVETLYAKADEQLYRAKHSGRNCVAG